MGKRKSALHVATIATVTAIAIGAPMAATAAIQWDFSAGANAGVSNGGTVYDPSNPGGAYTFSSGGIDVNVSGWAPSSTPSATTPITDYRVRTWSGLGVDRPGESNPEHSTDNSGPDEFVMFSFAEAITLEQVTAGWPSSSSSYDTDISVLAWTGVGPADIASRVYDRNNTNGLTQNGWSFVGHYADVSKQTDKTVTVNDGSQSVGNAVYTSSYWLVGAFNGAVGPGSFDHEKDYIKIAGLSGKTPPDISVPEPATLGLLLGGVLFAGARRRRTSR